MSSSWFTHFLNLASVNLQGVYMLMTKLLGLLPSEQALYQVCNCITGHLKVLQACCSYTMHNDTCVSLCWHWSYTRNGHCCWESLSGLGSYWFKHVFAYTAQCLSTIQLASKAEVAQKSAGPLVQHPPSPSPLLHSELLPEAGNSSALWDQDMMDDFCATFAPEPAQVCIAIMAMPKPDYLDLSIDCVAIAIFVNCNIEYACCICLPLMS